MTLSLEGIVGLSVDVNGEGTYLYSWWASMGSGEFTDFMVVLPSAASLEDIGMKFHSWVISCEQVSGCVILIKFLRRILLATW